MKKILIILMVISGVWSQAIAAEILSVRTLPRGTVITPADISITSANYELAGRFVGMQLKRTIYQGAPVQLTDLEKPVLVKRNAIVSMTYDTGALVITTTGRSLGQGGEGDMIQVMNGQSRKKVQAVVTGPDSVRVMR